MRYSHDFLEALGLNPEQQIVTTLEELSELRKGHVRAVHLTHRSHVEGILRRGLHYEKYGVLSSTAVSFSRSEEAVYSSTDPRFSYEGIEAVVMDIPIEEHRLHENVRLSPGVVPPSHIVGIIHGRNKLV